MKLLRREFLHLAGTAVAITLAILCGHAAWSQPAQTLKLVVPYPAGGVADFLARLLGEHIGRVQDQTMVVENRAGANAVIGTEAVARSIPDGKTLLINSQDLITTPHMRKLSYDPLASFEPICHLASSQTVITVSGASPYRTLADLIDAARDKPGELTVASTGPGGVHHIAAEMFKRAAKVNMTYIPYPGAAPQINALLGQHVTSAFMSFPNISEQLAAGTLRAVAVASPTRTGALSEVPTVVQSGYGDFDADTWWGVVAPAKTPKDTLSQLAGWFSAALAAADVNTKLVAQGFNPVGACGRDYEVRLRKYYDAYGRAIREANIRGE
jgi:tripartite-type tricarboxylate transporter receptor subunit TctC